MAPRKKHPAGTSSPLQLEDLPNIGKSIAGDLRSVGIMQPSELAASDALETYLALGGPMQHRHDPCVLYTLMAAQHYLAKGEALPWWKFTEEGKRLLASTGKGRQK